ncbi:MAG: allantoate amidohydrolase [Betaproteobacteria bacterium]|nr:allantoate amidohydrolase [Betaproteobacteria bacterium]
MERFLDALNQAQGAEARGMLAGLYEHSDWVVERALEQAPFRSLAHLKHAFSRAVRAASAQEKLALLRAHPELAGRAALAGELTGASQREQSRSGLQECSAEEYAAFHALNHAYRERFGWPFILAVGGPRANGLSRAEILESWRRRLDQPAESELAECLRQVHRIAELRLNARAGFAPHDGETIWDWAEALAVHSDDEARAQGQLTVTYLTAAHRRCAQQLDAWMRECGFDEVEHDALGNVVGRYWGSTGPGAPLLLTGSHFDTVRNGGRYDGRLGILAAMRVVALQQRCGRRWPFTLEVIGFAEEEGQRFSTSFLSASALVGKWDPAVLQRRDASGLSLEQVLRQAGFDPERIGAIARAPERVLGFLELHIEQGPVLLEIDLPLGVVTSINGSVRIMVELTGTASHAGTTPMPMRRDAACAAAEIVSFVERRCAAEPQLVGTVGMLQVPSGSINVIPGRCNFSLDVRAPDDAQRDRAVADILQHVEEVCSRRGIGKRVDTLMSVSAAPSDPELQAAWEQVVGHFGLPVHRMSSGAGHDAMRMAQLCPQAMLFLRCGNGGISHNPLETVTADDAQLAVESIARMLEVLAGSEAFLQRQ